MDWLGALKQGVVIPAHPLALTAQRKLDERRQRALTRYYLDAGAGGLAVGVHTTQFAIREAGLYRPVLELAMRSAAEWTTRSPLMIAGLSGRTAQAMGEAKVACELGYHAGLLSLAAMADASEDELVTHAQTVSGVTSAFENPQFSTAIGLIKYAQAMQPQRPRGFFRRFKRGFGIFGLW